MSAMDKVNNILGKLPFVKLAEKIPSGIIGKIPVLQTLVPFANHIAVGLLVVVLVANVGGGGVGVSGNIRDLTAKSNSLYWQIENEENNERRTNLNAQKAEIDEQLERLWADATAKGASYSGEHETLNKADQFEYDLTEDGTGVRIDEILFETEIIPLIINIPAEIEGYPVVEIGDYVFDNSRVISVTLPNSMKKLGERTLQTARIAHITLPPGLTEIGEWCFTQSGLTSVTIPASVTTMGDSIFFYCQSLTEIVISEGITEIPFGTFQACDSLREVTIPESVTTIRNNAFSGCSELTTVNLPSHTIEYRGDAVGGYQNFNFCPKLSLAMRKAIQDSGYTGGF